MLKITYLITKKIALKSFKLKKNSNFILFTTNNQNKNIMLLKKVIIIKNDLNF